MGTSDPRVELSELRGLLADTWHWTYALEHQCQTPETSGMLSRLYRHRRTLKKLIRGRALILGVPMPPEAKRP